MRVALVHDWLNGMRGGEKVFEVVCELFPDADVFTLFYEPNRVSPIIRSMNVREWTLPRWMPFLRSRYRLLLPFLPGAIEAMQVKGYDLVISTSHCVAKGVTPEPGQTPHICYCFTPMRYIWDKYADYFSDRRRFASWAMPLFRGHLQNWDVESAARVTHFLTTSDYVRARIREHYLREAQVIPAPVDYARFSFAERAPSDFFLIVSALEPYKHIDIAIDAFNRLRIPLKIAGVGTEARRLRRMAAPNIEFLGWVDDTQLASLYSCAEGLIFTAEEDFGIVPLEAMAAGCPVIALRKGGALETIVEGETGAFFEEQNAECLSDAINRFAPDAFDSERLRAHARQFDRPVFKQRLAEVITRLAAFPTSPSP
jgi:glycosyltransferase involved in cell wall biosynthesis